MTVRIPRIMRSLPFGRSRPPHPCPLLRLGREGMNVHGSFLSSALQLHGRQLRGAAPFLEQRAETLRAVAGRVDAAGRHDVREVLRFVLLRPVLELAEAVARDDRAPWLVQEPGDAAGRVEPPRRAEARRRTLDQPVEVVHLFAGSGDRVASLRPVRVRVLRAEELIPAAPTAVQTVRISAALLLVEPAPRVVSEHPLRPAGVAALLRVLKRLHRRDRDRVLLDLATLHYPLDALELGDVLE